MIASGYEIVSRRRERRRGCVRSDGRLDRLKGFTKRFEDRVAARRSAREHRRRLSWLEALSTALNEDASLSADRSRQSNRSIQGRRGFGIRMTQEPQDLRALRDQTIRKTERSKNRTTERSERPNGRRSDDRTIKISPLRRAAPPLRLFMPCSAQGAWAVSTQTPKPPGPLRRRVRGIVHGA